MLNIDDKYDKQTDKTRLTLEISKFLLYLITLIIAVVLAYNSLDNTIVGDRIRNAAQSRFKYTLRKTRYSQR